MFRNLTKLLGFYSTFAQKAVVNVTSLSVRDTDRSKTRKEGEDTQSRAEACCVTVPLSCYSVKERT